MSQNKVLIIDEVGVFVHLKHTHLHFYSLFSPSSEHSDPQEKVGLLLYKGVLSAPGGIFDMT